MLTSSASKITKSSASLHSVNNVPIPSGFNALRRLVKDPLGFCTEVALSHEGVVRLNLGLAQLYLVSEPQDLQYILRDNQRNFGKRGGMWVSLRTLLGNGLVTNEGSSWLRQRRMMQPQFHRRSLANMTALMTETIDQAIVQLQYLADTGRSVDISAEMKRLAMIVIVRALFGSNITSQEIDIVGDAMKIVLSHINVRMLLYFIPSWLKIPGDGRFREAIKQVDEVLYDVIHRHRRDSGGGDDLLSMLLNARDEDSGEGMSDQQLRDEMITIFVAGFETTATALTWLWYLLANHPEVERKLRVEVAEMLSGRVPTFADLSQLTYSKMVIQETMRLYPPAWMVSRTALNDDEVGGCHIPANAMLFLLPYVVHRNPAFWDEPEKFDPERFTPERSAERPHFAYIPFGAGPRLCIGEHFAMMEAQLILTMLIQRYRMQLVTNHPVKPTAATTLQPSQGILMTLHTRQRERG